MMAGERHAGGEAPTRCGFVAIVGAPNVGKSTLLNRLVGSKIAIVTHKVQTTRTRIRAIAIHDNAQIVFIDTPGIFKPRRRLDRAMVDAAWRAAGDADVVLFLIDAARGFDGEAEKIAAGLKKSGAPCALVINKVDLVERNTLLAQAQSANEALNAGNSFMISAENGDGVDDLSDWLAAEMPPGPWAYPEDQLADLPMRMLAAEITREKLMLHVHEEVPYAATVETETWKELKDGSIRIEQIIFIKRESHRQIILGKGGAKIKQVGSLARADLAEILQTKVHLFLFVKVRKNWEDDPERYRQMGLDYPK